MFADLVEETANSPGTSATVNLGGAVSGRRTFLAAFGPGATVGYHLASGAMWEIGVGVINAGTPNTLTRTTVERNSAGTTARLNFTGSVRVYNGMQADRVLWASSGNVWQARNRRLEGLAAGSGAGDAPRLDQTGWVQIRTDVLSGVGAWIVSLPSQYNRYRVEFEDVSPAASSAGMFLRYSVDGGSTWIQGNADYASRATVATGTAVTPYVAAASYAPLSAGSASSAFGAVEFQRAGTRAWRAWAHTRDPSNNHNLYESSGWCAVGSAEATHVFISFISQSIAAGRFRLKGAY